MPRKHRNTNVVELEASLAQDEDFLRPLVQQLVQETLEADMTECLGGAASYSFAGGLVGQSRAVSHSLSPQAQPGPR